MCSEVLSFHFNQHQVADKGDVRSTHGHQIPISRGQGLIQGANVTTRKRCGARQAVVVAM
jgi:hypothetical protein